MNRPEIAPARAAHAGCPSSAMEFDDKGARCTGCDVTWPLTTTTDGKAVGYVLPPATPAQRRRRFDGWVA